MADRIEFYRGATGALIAAVDSGMVPPVGSYINIQKKPYHVERVTYALDDAGEPRLARMRACVDLRIA